MTTSRPLVWLLVLVCSAVVCAAEKDRHVKIRVRGLGWLEGRETRLAVERLWGENVPAVLNSNQIEDAALFIASTLDPKGFQHPSIEVEAVRTDGTEERFPIDLKLEAQPPKDLEAAEVTFHVEPGVRYHLEDVAVEGLSAVSARNARDFFFPDAALILGRRSRAYSPPRLRRSADALESTLRQQGYAQTRVRVAEVRENHQSGAVVARIAVSEGPRWELGKIEFRVSGQEIREIETVRRQTGMPWSAFRSQDLAQEIRQEYYKKGYPDVRVRLEERPGPVENGRCVVDLIAHVSSGGQVAVGQVEFRGHRQTREPVLRRRVQVAPGDPLNPLQLERARYRLGRLGVFRSVDLSYQPAEGPVRDPVFDLVEEKALELSLMAGYGSYEQLRGGVEVLHRNVWGRAHQTRLMLVQSMKSSRADYTYTVPEIFGETIDGSVRAFGLQRDEPAFVRQEFGVTTSLKHSFDSFNADGTVGYTIQSLRNDRNQLSHTTGDNRQITVASIDLGLTHDGRDNPLRPRRGYRWFVQAELANRNLGGQATYQRVETGASYHTSWGRGRWVHAGLTHGVVTTFGSPDDLLPVNKRFYPGGETSIRGYPEGEAAPRAEDGRFLGAKSYVLLDFEIEQALTQNWSVVVFTDAMGVAASLHSYPFDTELLSVGLGLRYQTLIGPLRLEYGHNVLKRDGDPRGALLFSVGFPF